ncbi:Ig-like domain-containing protein [Rhodopirellula baltica]|uniref:Uncharacterized protein n=1 Tax=Rhodopirellula baltica WH47 TaxID=991778 RepID=F2AUR6_RHOBT|nr:hypothetical protein [Rhodopirellula baltica]EGF26632.1 hypothetical protein RBWH47_03004 [Rhodopirellula baltica WH47]
MMRLSLQAAVVLLFAVSDRCSLSADENDLFTIVGEQTTETITVQVTDPNDDPIEGAVVTPWALRYSQGHGHWLRNGKDTSGMKPEAARTDKNGIANIAYPFYRDAAEKSRTMQVSVHVRHQSFCLADAVHMDVPSDDVFEIAMQPAASIQFRPVIAVDDDFTMDQIQVLRSDMGSWQNSFRREIQGDHVHVDQLFPGESDFLLVRLVDGAPTHFSDILEVELTPGANPPMDVPLRPATSVSGRLADNVPRPIVDGRVLAMTVPPKSARDRVTWSTWAPIDADGTFLIEGWPKNQSIQIIGLTENHRVRSPEAAQNLSSHFGHPVVFDPPLDKPITLEMEPLHACRVQVKSLDDKPLDDVKVTAYPNVLWTNWGSQVYGKPLTRSADFFGNPDLLAYFQNRRDQPLYPSTFIDQSDEDGVARLKLPVGKWGLYVDDDQYEIPILLGRRSLDLTVSNDSENSIVMRLVPKGTDLLGDYDSLAGVVFGCSTREGERICALPEVREKIDEFVRRIQEAEDPQDPKILSEAFMVVSDAFLKAGDQDEAAKWRRKSLKMKVKLTQAISTEESSN